MKKLYFTILSAMLGLAINAQTLTQSNHSPILGEMFSTRRCDSVNIAPGAAGSGVTWTFSATPVYTTLVNNYTVVSVASTGSASAYPTAAVATSFGPNKNSYYTGSAADLKYWGGDVQLGSLGATVTYTGTAAASVAKYPMSLSTTTTTPVSGTLTVSGNNGTFNGTCTATADGTGTLKLPNNVTFNNCIRVIRTQNLNFNVIVSGTITQIQYDYYNAVSKAPLFTISTSSVVSIAGNSSQTVTTIASNYIALSLTEAAKDVINFAVFPNPASDNVTLSFYNENADNASYEMINALGQVVKKDNIGNDKGINRYELNIETLPTGIYFAKVMVGSHTSIQKISVQ